MGVSIVKFSKTNNLSVFVHTLSKNTNTMHIVNVHNFADNKYFYCCIDTTAGSGIFRLPISELGGKADYE